MSARRADVLDIVRRYAAGFFPLYDPWDRFYWERLTVRAVIPVNREAAAKVRQVAGRAAGRFEIRYSTAVDAVIGHLRDEAAGGVKQNSWVRGEVLRIYAALREAGLLETVEAWEVAGKGKSNELKRAKGKRRGPEAGERLVGGLVGIVLPGVFIAETMFGLVGDASKVCLCRLVEDCFAAGVEMIDVQTPHDRDEFGMRVKTAGRTAHPCLRLGEKSMPLGTFLREFQKAWKGAFEGDAGAWVACASAARQERAAGEAMVKVARRWRSGGGAAGK